MKSLSIRQPWAELIVQGKKKIEIRTWNTSFRDYFLIHASKKVDKEAIERLDFDLGQLERGIIVGYANLLDVIIYKTSEEFLKDKNEHLSFEAKEKYPVYGFVLGDIHRIKSVRYKGRLGFFEVPEIDYKIFDKLI